MEHPPFPPVGDPCILHRSQMANGGLFRPVMSPGLKSQLWSTH